MRHVYFVVPDLGYAGYARQVSLLAPAMARAGWDTGVYSLGGGPFGDPIRTAGLLIERQSGFAGRDLRSWGVLRRLVPLAGGGTVHAFGLRVIRRLMVATLGMPRPRVVVSLTGREKLTWFDRRFLRLVARVLVPHGAGADGLIRQGVPGEKIVEVAPAVADAPPLPDRDTFLRANDLPPDAKMIMSAGRMGTRLRLFDAVWAFEVLRYGDPAIHLVVVGDGPGREGMQRTAHSLAPEGTQTRFLGARSDTSALLGLADVVYVPNRAGGVNVALEAMAAGRAVVANKTPDLADVIRDGETGFLIPVGDHTATARRLWQILRDPVERARVGEAARRMVHDRHNVPTLVCAMEDIYGE